MAWDNNSRPHTTRAQRNRIRARDQGICQHCGQPGSEVDHINNTRSATYNQDHNLQLLCKPCHNKKTQQEAKTGLNRWKLPTEPHPGIKTHHQ